MMSLGFHQACDFVYVRREFLVEGTTEVLNFVKLMALAEPTMHPSSYLKS